MANYAAFSFGISIAGDGISTTYSFNPSNGAGVLGLPTNNAQKVLSVVLNAGPTSPTVTATVALGIVTLTFSAALQAVDAALDNLYNLTVTVGY
jgi:hypothetical protein